MNNKRIYTFRVDDVLWQKFHYISTKNKRSVAKQLEMIVEIFIDAFEKENGEIQIDSEE